MKVSIDLKWTRNDTVNCTATSLQQELPQLTNSIVKAKFGKLPAGCNSNEKYSEHIIITNNIEPAIEAKGFFDDKVSGIYTLYCFYGEWRIGGSSKNKFTKELEAYLLS